MNVTITPPDRGLYVDRCKAARDCFQHADIMPPFLVVYMCYSVLYRALGGNAAILRYVVHQVASAAWSDLQRRSWWTWHLYIRCRSRGEIQELLDRDLEGLTGEREWPDVVGEEEGESDE